MLSSQEHQLNYNPAQPWYHGSAVRLTILRTGSTITQKRALARVFSHKPTIVSVSDEGEIKHNGNQMGYLYLVDEKIKPADVIPHPRTTMATGDEWLTQRELRLQFLGPVEMRLDDQLSEMELANLLVHPASQQKSQP
jgi:hypothetical protein